MDNARFVPSIKTGTQEDFELKTTAKTLCFAALFLTSIAAAASPSSASKPNVVLFFVDDLGWYDLGFRNAEFESPHIDRLAEEGMSFERAYIPSPTCSPSRAALVTGQHPARLKLVRHIPVGPKHAAFDEFGRTEEEFNLWRTDPAQFPCRNWLPLEHTTYAEALGELGYVSAFLGKWHLGHEPFHPIHQGFDRQIGTSNFGHPGSYHPPYFKNGNPFAEENDRYLTDKLTDEAVRFIDRYERDEPFMLSMWYYNVHSPHQGRRDWVKHFESKGLTGKRAHYAAMVKAVDQSVGRIRDSIKQKGIERETILILLSDQGSLFEIPQLRGCKRVDTLCEGGARVPFLFHWAGVTTPGARNLSVVQSTDLFPTLVEIAGGDPAGFENLDGVSLLSTIKNNSVLQRGRPIFGYRAYEDLYASVRRGDWKLLACRSGEVSLYNVAADPKEEENVADGEPRRVREMLQQLVAWEKEMGVEQYSGVQ